MKNNSTIVSAVKFVLIMSIGLLVTVGVAKFWNWSERVSRQQFQETYEQVQSGLGYVVERKDGGIWELYGWQVHSNCPAIIGDLNQLVITNQGKIAQVFTGKPIEPGTKVAVKSISHRMVIRGVGEVIFYTADPIQ